jgi:hypothetical protein
MSEITQAQGYEQSGIVYAPGAKPAGAAGAAASFTYGGGRLLASVRVHLIFWGTAWKAWPAPTATVGGCTDAVVTILASDYMNSLTQYGVGGGTLGSVTVVAESIGGSPADPPNPFSNDDVWQLVEHLRAANRIPTADIGSSAQGLYVVVMPSGVGSNQPGVIGEHSYYWFGSPATNVPYAWITQSSVDSFSEVFSHELVESCTDPEGTGWTSATACGVGHGGWCEIGDVCQGTTARVHGVLVQRYWSNADNQCVVPDDPKVSQDAKIRKDQKDSKDHKDTKDRKELKDRIKEKDNPKELKDGAKEKEHAKELERPSDLAAQLRQVADQLQSVAEGLAGEQEPFIESDERPTVGDVDQS